MKRQRTNDYPIFCGPMFLHGNSDKDTFFLFFQHLAGVLAGCAQNPVLGSDEEKALHQAMSSAFPSSPRLVCTQHLKKNLKYALADKVGMPKKERCDILNKLFSFTGIVATASNYMEVEDNILTLVDKVDDVQMKNILDRVSTLLVENAKALDRPGLALDKCFWTNNNCESINHVLKQACAWKSLELVDLVQKLHMVVEGQYREIQRAICGIGDFRLVEEYKKFGVPRDVWIEKDSKQKKRHLRKYALCIKETLIRSTNFEKVALEPKHNGKKPRQRKRKVAEKTVSAPLNKKVRDFDSDSYPSDDFA